MTCAGWFYVNLEQDRVISKPWLKNCSYKTGFWANPWSILHWWLMGKPCSLWCYPCPGGPEHPKKAGWANHEGYSSMVSTSNPDPRFLSWLPWMMNCKLQDKNKLFRSQVGFGHVFYHRTGNPHWYRAMVGGGRKILREGGQCKPSHWGKVNNRRGS